MDNDFETQLITLLSRYPDDDEVLGQLDPDTAGVDLVALCRRLLATVDCRLCRQPVAKNEAHAHGPGTWVCDGCWDERLRSTS